MSQIDLREIPIFVINLQGAHKRRQSMTEQLNALGLDHQFIRAIKCSPGPLGVALSHLKTLKQPGLQPPFLVLEDDCRILPENFTYRYEFPSETDALYLGHSHFGLEDKKREGSLKWGAGVRWGKQGNVKYKPFDDNYIRIFNMLARHAIVYISGKYIKNAIAANLSSMLDLPFTFPGDILYAEMQPAHLVLSPKEVSFYQAEQFGGIEKGTRNSIVSEIAPYEGTEY